MKNYSLAGLTCISILALHAGAAAHGGVYRGPGDIVPPGAGGPRTGNPGIPGPTTPSPSAPGAPAPNGPKTPGPVTPGVPPGGNPLTPGGRNPTTPGGIQLGTDFTIWQFWWEFNKDPFINLREAIHASSVETGSADFFLGAHRRMRGESKLKPSASDIRNIILPALRRTLESTENRDITSSCMVALAKIGQDHPDFDIQPIFEKNLAQRSQEIRETAALAMGIAAFSQARGTLIDLALDRPAGRKLVPGSQVDSRTRSFAIYALGLIAHRTNQMDVKREIFDNVAGILADRSVRNRNLKVAAIQAMSLLNLPPTDGSTEKEAKLLTDTLSALEAFYDRKEGRGEDLIKAHVPTAVAKLLGRGSSDRHEHFKQRFMQDLESKKKRGLDIYRSAALALGQMALPEGSDERYSTALHRYFSNGRDQQARYFSMLALGQIGGDKNRSRLGRVLRKGQKVLERPWAALALGVMNFKARQKDDKAVDVDVSRDLLEQFEKLKTPSARSAFAVALGLSGFRPAANSLKTAMRKHHAKDEFVGYLCLGLALMGDRTAREEIHAVVKRSVRRPKVLQQAAIALGKLGDRTVARTLIEMITTGEQNLAKLSAAAAALGFIGDRSTIKPLKKMLENDQLTPLSRAFAAVALGGVADKEALPWSSKISRNMNYRAAVETLTQSGTGVLDIL